MKRVMLAGVLVASTVAHAAIEDIPTDRQIIGIQVHQESALVQIAPTFNDNQGCIQSGSGWVVVDLGKDKSLYSTVLAGAMAKQKMGFGLAGCGGERSAYPLIKRVDISP